MKDLKKIIRNVPDFPKKGIVFRDITTLIGEKGAFKEVVDELVKRYENKKIDYVVSVESRGFIFGAALAHKLQCGLVPVRKKGKLPAATHSATYDLEYGKDTLEIHKDAFEVGKRVLILDDLLATGGTTNAAIELVKKLGGKIEEAAFVIELGFLNGREKIKDVPVFSLV
ncbi:MAG: adenine phosphoribosyltransferase, partial [Candidatus Omnitrophica bacterium]|nr:adenine phosphoribosyltransferase [Candidatus Omnitrophota bacterium]